MLYYYKHTCFATLPYFFNGQVDGFITASSLEARGTPGGGGSGGSIRIQTLVFTGGHTGAVQSLGGYGSAGAGGGSGGRVAVYYQNRFTDSPYRSVSWTEHSDINKQNAIKTI